MARSGALFAQGPIVDIPTTPRLIDYMEQQVAAQIVEKQQQRED
jgi:hypothetical protein